MLGFPVKLDETPCAPRLPAPDLGAHTEDVLRAAGFTLEEIGAATGRGCPRQKRPV